jgi:hypothetical protein
LKRTPKLQKQYSFENIVSRATWKFALNGKLVSQKPKRPALGSKSKPRNASKLSRETMEDRKQISKGGGIPVHLKPLPKNAPSKSRQRTIKEDVLDILVGVAQLAQAIQRPMTVANLSFSRQATSGQLPNEDSNFKGAGNLPNILSVGNCCALNQLQVKRFGGKMTRRLEGPGHTVWHLRGLGRSELTKQHRPVLPLSLTKGSAEVNVPRAIPP